MRVARITVDGAIVEGATPHFSSCGSYADPTHCHHFACRTFDYLSFSADRRGFIYRILRRFYNPGPIALMTSGPSRLRKETVRLRFNWVFARIGIQRLANVYPEFYEAFFAGLIPARGYRVSAKDGKTPSGAGKSRPVGGHKAIVRSPHPNVMTIHTEFTIRGASFA